MTVLAVEKCAALKPGPRVWGWVKRKGGGRGGEIGRGWVDQWTYFSRIGSK